MAARERIGKVALASLGFALALAVVGKLMELSWGLPFLGGLVAAFGEAALVGGLADWFAVRALFAHPFGIPFPHTAIIPNNRKRLTAEIRKLVVNEWLPRDVLARKVSGFDFVGRGFLPLLPTLRPQLRELLRTALGEALRSVEPRAVAGWLTRGVSGRIEPGQIAPWLAEMVRRAREQGWLEPVLREVVWRLEQWAAAPACRKFIRQRLDRAATSYRERDGWKDLLMTLGEISGGVDLDEASSAVQMELRRFASEQMASGSHMQTMLQDGLAHIEGRLRGDPEFLASITAAVGGGESAPAILARVLSSLRDEALRQVEAEHSPWLDLALGQIDGWMTRLQEDAVLRGRVNEWCRNLAVAQIDQHHALIGVLVEEQMNRLSDAAMTELIEKRVGEDLNWIRLNGTFVGGLIGVALYLLVALGRWLSAG